MTKNLLSFKNVFFAITFLLSSISYSQTVDVAIATADNCMNPLPNGGTYTNAGTLNGKNYYTKGVNLRIIWTGSQWELQGDDPAIGGVTWTTGWFNTKNTATPPSDCWAASFGCFPITLSGPDAFQIVNYTTSSVTNINTAANTITYTVNFSGTINNLTTSNFSLTQNGVTGAAINSVSQVSGSQWNIIVNYGTGNGSIVLNIANQTGASAILGCTTTFPITTATHYTTNAPVTLSAGDIAFTGYNSNTTDDFSFIILKNGGLPIGTKIFFTDNGFNNTTSSLTSTEGIVIWEATSAVAQLSQVKISISGTVYTPSTGTVTLVSSNQIALSSAGDQILAFQGFVGQPTYTSAIHLNSDGTGTLTNTTTWDDFSNGTSSSRSALPTGLTSGTNAIIVVSGTVAPFVEYDNGVYNCTGTPNSDINALRLLINNRDNWTKQDATNLTTPPSCTFLGNEDFTLNTFNLYPNPTQNNITLQINELDFNNDMKFTIFDSNGRNIESQKILSFTTLISLEKLNSGIYFIEISSSVGKTTKKFIKQ